MPLLLGARRSPGRCPQRRTVQLRPVARSVGGSVGRRPNVLAPPQVRAWLLAAWRRAVQHPGADVRTAAGGKGLVTRCGTDRGRADRAHVARSEPRSRLPPACQVRAGRDHARSPRIPVPRGVPGGDPLHQAAPTFPPGQRQTERELRSESCKVATKKVGVRRVSRTTHASRWPRSLSAASVAWTCCASRRHVVLFARTAATHRAEGHEGGSGGYWK